MKEITQALTGLIWSVRQLQTLIPSGKAWDNRVTNIVRHMQYAEGLLEQMNMAKYPFKCTVKETDESFIPTMMDFDNAAAYWQRGQSSGNGQWLAFSDLIIEKNPYFDFPKKKSSIMPIPFDIWDNDFPPSTLRNIRERREAAEANTCGTCKGEGTIKGHQHSPLIPAEETMCPTCRGSGTKTPKA